MPQNQKIVDPCQNHACAIQSCLSANNYQESKCERVLIAMRDCCLEWKDSSKICDGLLKKFDHQVKLLILISL